MSWLLRRIWSGYTAAHNPAPGGGGPGAGADDLLMETGDHLLLETGDAILLE